MRKLVGILATAAAAFSIANIAFAQEATQDATQEAAESTGAVLEIAEGEGALRVAHFSPDAGPVDVFVNGEVLIEGLAFGQVTEFAALEGLPADFEVAVAPAGEGIEAAVLGPVTLTITDQQGTLAIATGSVANGTLDLVTTAEGLSDTGEDTTEITVLHQIEGDLLVDVLANGEILAEGLAYGDTATAFPPSGVYDLQVTVSGDPDTVLFDLPGTELNERTSYITAAIGTLDEPSIVLYGVDLTTLQSVDIVSEGDVFAVGGTEGGIPQGDATDEAGGTTGTTGSSTDLVGLNAAAEPNFGSVDLEAGFTPDPASVDVVSGGDIDASTANTDCRGTVTAQPDVVLNWSGDSAFLRVFAVSGGDTTLVVLSPDGEVYCNDDVNGLNPQVDIENPAEGAYAVWVGSYSAGEELEATLYFSELEDVDATTVGG